MTDTLIKSRDRLLNLCKSLSAKQATARLGADTWSIADIVEHLALSERGSMIGVKRTLSQPEATGDLLAQTNQKSELIQTRIPTLASRAAAPDLLLPSGRFKEWPGALLAFEQARSNTLDMEAVADDAFDSRVMPHPILGPLTLRQWFHFTAEHTERHTRKIEEILAYNDA